MPTQITLDITYCDECTYCQVNDVQDHYCHSWHRKTDPWGYCYRGKPNAVKQDTSDNNFKFERK